MNNTYSFSLRSPLGTAITDMIVVVMACLIPALSHLSPFPLFYLDPMRILLFAALLITRNTPNACVLAVVIPLFSSLIAHHPPFFKALLISVELLANIAIFKWFLNRFSLHPAILFFLSTVISKLLYYACKFIFISFTLVDGQLITTSLWIQLATVVFLSLLFGFFFKRKHT